MYIIKYFKKKIEQRKKEKKTNDYYNNLARTIKRVKSADLKFSKIKLRQNDYLELDSSNDKGLLKSIEKLSYVFNARDEAITYVLTGKPHDAPSNFSKDIKSLRENVKFNQMCNRKI